MISLTTMGSCIRPSGKERDTDSAAVEVRVEDLSEEAAVWADSVANDMDTLQLAAQVMMPAVFASDDEWTLRRVKEYAARGIGGIILLKGDAHGAKAIADSMIRNGDVYPFVAVDAEWGLGMRLSDAPRYPANGKLGEDVDEQLMYDYGYEVARECRQVGINMVLGPVLDVNGTAGIMGMRSFGSDPGRVTSLGLSYARGLEDGGVMSVAKHFPGQGSVGKDTHSGKGVVNRSLHMMDSVDLQPFREWSKVGLGGVMVGHLAVPAIDGTMLPAAVSPVVIRDLLIRDLGFTGLVFTDAMNMGGAEGHGADLALMAGAHLIVAPRDTEQELSRIIQAIRTGKVSIEELRARIGHILFYKYLLRLRDNSNITASPGSGTTFNLRTPYTDSLRQRLISP